MVEKILCICGCNGKILKYDKRGRERFFIKGHSNKGKHHTEETKHKISRLLSGENHPNYGKKRSPETIYKMSVSQLGVKNHHFGKHHSEETKEKLRIIFYNKNITSDTFKNRTTERFLKSILSVNGIIHESQKKLYGIPDIFIEPNICIFADGCFYHGCLKCYTLKQLRYKSPQRAFKRDPIVNQKLKNEGYVVLRFWEHEIYNNLTGILEKIKEVI